MMNIELTNCERLELRRLVRDELHRCSGSTSVLGTNAPKPAGLKKLTNLFSLQIKTELTKNKESVRK